MTTERQQSFDNKKQTNYSRRLKTALMKYTIAVSIGLICLFVGAAIFLYLENCYDIVPYTGSIDYKLCQRLLQNHNNIFKNDSQINELCKESVREFKLNDISCDWGVESVAKYFDLTTAIGFTVGELALV